MIDKAHLQGKRVAFKIDSIARSFIGNVQSVEDDGFWLHAPDLVAEASRGSTWSGEFKKPVIFLPSARLNWLMASSEGQ